MATYRKVPARILCVDYVGVSRAAETRYRRRADQELGKLEEQVLRGDLDQGTREVQVEPNVLIECVVMFALKKATVYIGRDKNVKMKEDPCYCCSPCLVAGLIISIDCLDPESLEPEEELGYKEDGHYIADIMICQAGDSSMPVKITVMEERSVGGASVYSERTLMNRSFGAPMMIDVPFSDHHWHEVGSSVMVLVQPLFNFADYPGEYSPCINRRMVADGSIIEPYPTITTRYINSTGFSCQINSDEQVWNEDMNGDDIPPDPPADDKYYPFRILPIKVESCLS